MLGENGTLIGGLGPEQSRKDQGSKLHRCCLEGSYAYHYTTDALVSMFCLIIINLKDF